MVLIEELFFQALSPLRLPDDQLRLVFIYTLHLPLCILFRFLPTNKNLKHFICAIVGFLSLAYLYGFHVLHSLVYSFLTFFTMKYFAKHHYVFIGLSIAYIFVVHIHRMWNDPGGWTMDYTTSQMLLIIKMTSFMFNVHDGITPQSELSERQKKMAVYKYPSLLEFFGHSYFFPGVVCGRIFEYQEYQDFISLEMFKEFNYTIPFSPLAIVKVLFRAVPFLVLILIFNRPAEVVREVLHTTMQTQPLWKNTLYLYGTVLFHRSRYIIIFLYGELLFNIIGIGYSGKNEKGELEWERGCNINVLKVEFPTSPKMFWDNWNMMVQSWLRYYIFERIPKGPFYSKRAEIAFFVSAVWHGIYPGYFFVFGVAAIIREIARITRRRFRPLFLNTVASFSNPKTAQIVYDICTAHIMWWIAITYFPCFMLLNYEDIKALLKVLYFIPLVVPILFGIFVYLFIKPPQTETKRD